MKMVNNMMAKQEQFDTICRTWDTEVSKLQAMLDEESQTLEDQL